jgi:hypothetical protein
MALPGLGLGIRNQAEPVHHKVNVRSFSVLDRQPETHDHPTAQAPPDGPALTARSAAMLPGLGLGTCDQDDPCRRKITVR